ncbi:MAG: twin-arginine translocation signal domain-containing protein [Chloroflexi bacterium]|nr:twin-arginine translocation signal domain-containing protein [Chloroflexota bacterium]
MAGQNEATARNTVTRRGFLKRVALVGAAASALGILSRGRIGGIGQQGRSTPADLPGAGSIFQPRGDSRIQPERYESRLFSFIRKERVADTPPHGD